MKKDFIKKLYELKKSARNGKCLQEALKAASLAIKSRSQALRIQALYLFEELVEKGVGFKEAIKAATLAIKSPATFEPWDMTRHDIHECGYFLFRQLFAKDQGFEQAKRLARSCHNKSNTNFRAAHLMLLKELVDHGKEIDFALQAAIAYSRSRSSAIKWAALDLFDTLVARGVGHKEAALVLKSIKATKNKRIKEIATSLAKSLQ